MQRPWPLYLASLTKKSSLRIRQSRGSGSDETTTTRVKVPPRASLKVNAKSVMWDTVAHMSVTLWDKGISSMVCVLDANKNLKLGKAIFMSIAKKIHIYKYFFNVFR